MELIIGNVHFLQQSKQIVKCERISLIGTDIWQHRAFFIGTGGFSEMLSTSPGSPGSD